MSKKQTKWYYVGVATNEGVKLVTSVDRSEKTAEWDKLEKPMEFNKELAEDLVFGLVMNMNIAFVIESLYPLDTQLYRYSAGHFEWVRNEE